MESLKDNYFIEFSIDGVLEVEEDKKEIIVDKINKLVSKILKNEKALQLNVNMAMISESNLAYSMASLAGLAEDN